MPMRMLRAVCTLGVIVCLLAAPPAAANNFVHTLQQQLEQLDKALFAPREVERFSPIDASASCEQLYLEVSRLVPESRAHPPNFFANPANAAIAAAGALWTPAFYLWGVPEYARYRQTRHIDNASGRIVALRAALADRQCFVR